MGTESMTLRTVCNLCVVRCPLVCHVEDGQISNIKPDLDHPLKGTPCVKGLSSKELVYNEQRLRYPMVRTRPKGSSEAGWKRITWDDGLNLATEKLREIAAKYGPKAVLFAHPTTSGPAGDYSPWVYRLVNRFGSPNFIRTTNLCQWNRDTGAMYTLGVSTPRPDYQRSDLIVIWGHDPTNSVPEDARSITDAVRNGAKLVVVDPRESGLVSKASSWLPVLPGTDGALALGLMNDLISRDGFDREFVARWTNAPFVLRSDNHRLVREADIREGGSNAKFAVNTRDGIAIFDPASAPSEENRTAFELEEEHDLNLLDEKNVKCETVFSSLRKICSKFDPESVEKITTIPARKVVSAGRLLIDSKRLSYWFWNGIQQHSNGFEASRNMLILFALKGCYDVPGGNVKFTPPMLCSVAGREFLPKEMESQRIGLERFPLGPPKNPGSVPGYVAYDAILTGRPYPIKGMVSFGGNLLLSNGDSLKGKKALESLEFYMIAEMFLTPTAQQADLVLPVTSFLESPTFVSWTRQSSLHVQMRKRIVRPVGESRPDIEIIFELAKRLGFERDFWGGSIEKGIDYLLEPVGLSYSELIEKEAGVHFSSDTTYRKYVGGFPTPSGKIEIYSSTLYEAGLSPLPSFTPPIAFSQDDRYPLVLTTRKILPFFQSSLRSVSPLRKLMKEPEIEIHEAAAAERGISNGDWVYLITGSGKIRLKARLTDSIHPRVVCTQHGWWQSCLDIGAPSYDPFSSEGSNVNMIVSNENPDPVSGGIDCKSLSCEIVKITE